MEKYTIIRAIGDGAQGTAFLAKRNSSGGTVVLKRLPFGALSSSEMSVMLKMKHSNIIPCREAFVHENNLYLVLMYAEGGDLAQHLKSGKKPSLEIKLHWFLQCCHALQYCHENRVLHRDIKLENIFLSKDLSTAFLGDFGVAKDFGATADGAAVATTLVGSPTSLSPEVLSGTAYSFMSDVWSMGCVLYELMCEKRPFPGDSFMILMNKICSGKFDPIPKTVPPEVSALISRMLNVDVNERIPISEVCSVIETFLSPTKPALDDVSCDSWIKAKLQEIRSIQKYVDRFRVEDEARIAKIPRGAEKADLALGRAKRMISSPVQHRLPNPNPIARGQTPPTPSKRPAEHRRTYSDADGPTLTGKRAPEQRKEDPLNRPPPKTAPNEPQPKPTEPKVESKPKGRDAQREELRAMIKEQRAVGRNVDIPVEIVLPSNLRNLPQNKV